MKNVWLRRHKNRPNIILAPMAGYSDSAMRGICKKFGADIVVSEMVSADAIFHNKKLKNLRIEEQKQTVIARSKATKSSEGDPYGQSKNKIATPYGLAMTKLFDSDKTLSLMKFGEAERPYVVQLFGKYPEKFAYAAKWVEENIKPDGIDINMGCPARKVVGSDHGSALLKNPDLACEIAKAVKESISIPVSVKTRLGWSHDDEILEFAPRLIETGIDALIIHGRTYKDGFKGRAQWKNIYEIKKQITRNKYQTNHKFQITNNKKIAIIGNGDVEDYQEAIDKSTNGKVELDGVMIGRAVFGKPWIFQKRKVQSEKRKIKETILMHARLAHEDKGEHGMIEFRKHLLAYLKGMDNAKKLRLKAVNIKNIKNVQEIVEKMPDA